MTEFLRSWLLGIAGASLIGGALVLLLPAGKRNGAARLAAGLLVLIMLARPIVELTKGGMPALIGRYKAGAGEFAEDITRVSYTLAKTIIEADALTYISDKAEALGIENAGIRVYTTREKQSGLPYPYAVEISAAASPEQKASLTRFIEAELGIAAGEQYWRAQNEG